MASKDDAKAGLRSLARHADFVIDTYLTTGSGVDETDENAAAIEALRKHRLIWRMDASEPYQLKNPVVRLLDQQTQAHRRQLANENIAQLWSTVTDRFESYRASVQQGAFEDRERLEREIRELMHEIIDDISTTTANYLKYIHGGFSYVTNPELRIQENEKVIRQAQRLNDLLGTFRVSDLAEQAGNTPFLKRLLLKHLQAEVEQAQNTLSVALEHLGRMLVQQRESQRLNQMIDAIGEHYDKHPGFTPSIEDMDLSRCPTPINRARPMTLKAYNNPEDFRQDEVAVPLAAKARRQPAASAPTQEYEPQPIDDCVEPETVNEQHDPLDEAVEQLISFILERGSASAQVSAADLARNQLPDHDRSDWLQAVASAVDALHVRDQARIHMSFEVTTSSIFDGNDFVSDIWLGPAAEAR
ncbi:hypothetical protein [Salicola sp. Rm-C-2C1-2]|uniref:hypothetical protein n=1 Tax=Salicola sp. Rm-C-2C1-2 TaxID=3141321 RepID=UPI0032E3ED93